jgi:hypothetical protein
VYVPISPDYKGAPLLSKAKQVTISKYRDEVISAKA